MSWLTSVRASFNRIEALFFVNISFEGDKDELYEFFELPSFEVIQVKMPLSPPKVYLLRW